MIASIDIFDTSLTRLVGLPDSLFILLGQRLRAQGLIPFSPEVFARCRVQAEALSRENAPNGEPTLCEIYSALAWSLTLSAASAECMMQQELAIESELLRRVPGVAESIKRLNATAESTVFLSDMYLPSAFLKEQLIRLLGDSGPIEVMVSCESRASKVSGDLFKRLMNDRGVQAVDLLHLGNSPWVDEAVPNKLGIRTQSFRDADLNRYEIILEEHRWETEGLTSLFAGASRMARLTVPARDVREHVVRNVSAGVAAPVLVGYVLWVLKRASEQGLKRLYFVSRDGELLLEIASGLKEKLELDIELRYLYGSRQAWHLPAFGLTNGIEEDWLLFNIQYGLSVEILLETVGLKPHDVEPALFRHGFMPRSWSKLLGLESREAFKRFISDPEVRSCIQVRAEAARSRMLTYLRQEGMMDATRSGVVDLGWSGRMFDSLWAVLKLEQARAPRGFLFGRGDARAIPDEMPKEAYLVDFQSGQGYRNHISMAVYLLETFCKSTHGMVDSYALQDGVITPMFKKATDEWAVAADIPKLRETTQVFLDNLILNSGDVNRSVNLRPVAAELLAALWNAPTRPEANVWGGHVHVTIQTDSYGFPLARPFQLRDALRRLLHGWIRRPSSPWEAASLRLTPSIVRHALRAAGGVRTTGARLARRLRLRSS